MIAAFALTLLSLQAPSAPTAPGEFTNTQLGLEAFDPPLPQPAAALPQTPAPPLAIRISSASSRDTWGCFPGSTVFCRHAPAILNAGWVVPGTPTTSNGPCAWTGWAASSAYACSNGAAFDRDGYQVWLLQQQIADDFVEQNVGLRHGKEIRAQQEAAGTAPRWTSGGEAPAPRSAPSASSAASRSEGGAGAPHSAGGSRSSSRQRGGELP